ncbi:MAG: YfcC family protein, partial [Bacteroidetes bacterium]
MLKKSPDALVILSTILLIFVILTWIVPAGEFDRQVIDGHLVVVSGTYHTVEASPQGFWELFRAPLKGIVSAADIIGFVLLVGGAFSILTATGAMDAGLQQVLRFAEKNPQLKIWIIPLLMVIFSLGGATFGMSEEVLVFIMITIPMAKKMGYDNIVGIAIPFVGAGMGFAGAPFNPFTVGIAQGIAELPIFSGFEYRSFVWLVFTTLGILFVMWYAKRIEKHPEKSPIGMVKAEFEHGSVEELELTGRRKIILLLFLASLIGIMIGALQYDWYIIELAGLFVLLGLISAIVAGLSAEQTVKAFTQGAKDLLMAAILIGFSKA